MLIGEHRTRQFPESTIGLVDGDGHDIGPKRTKGVEVVLYKTLSGYCAEVMDIRTGGERPLCRGRHMGGGECHDGLRRGVRPPVGGPGNAN